MISAVNSIAGGWFRYMASASLQASLLTLVLLGMVLIGRRWSPALRHALLMIALLKFLIPPTVSLPTGLAYHVKPIAASRTAFPAAVVVPIVQQVLWPADPSPTELPIARAASSSLGMRTRASAMSALHLATTTRQSLTVDAWLMLLHLVGALLILALVIEQKFRLRRVAMDATPAADPELLQTHADLCAAMNLVRPPRLLLSLRKHAPMTFGAWSPVVVLRRISSKRCRPPSCA
jgi:hypothetical protein